jgi:hypothetical protein
MKRESCVARFQALDTTRARRLHAASMIGRLRHVSGLAALATLLPCAGAWGANDPNQGWIQARPEKVHAATATMFEQVEIKYYSDGR